MRIAHSKNTFPHTSIVSIIVVIELMQYHYRRNNRAPRQTFVGARGDTRYPGGVGVAKQKYMNLHRTQIIGNQWLNCLKELFHAIVNFDNTDIKWTIFSFDRHTDKVIRQQSFAPVTRNTSA